MEALISTIPHPPEAVGGGGGGSWPKKLPDIATSSDMRGAMGRASFDRGNQLMGRL